MPEGGCLTGRYRLRKYPPPTMERVGPRWLVGGIAVVVSWAVLGALPAEAQRTYRVRGGDSFSRIARRLDVSPWNLALANDMKPSGRLRPGMLLRVPPDGVVYVRSGQSLWLIARRNGCSMKALARANHMEPGNPVRPGDRLVLPGYDVEGDGSGETWGEPENAGTVHLKVNEHKAELRLRKGERKVPYDDKKKLAELMADELDEDADAPPAHPRLAVLLADISDHFGSREIIVYSGFREANGYTNETSRHVDGRAVDIRVRGVSKRAVWNYCRTLRRTGCGFYPRSLFVHVDVRGEAAQWVDWSRPGRRPMYGNLRGPYQWKGSGGGRVGRDVTRPDEVPLDVEVVDRPDDAESQRTATARTTAADEAS